MYEKLFIYLIYRQQLTFVRHLNNIIFRLKNGYELRIVVITQYQVRKMNDL